MFAEITAPPWWDDALQELFPLEGDGPPSYACFGVADAQMIEVWELRVPGKGYVMSLSDGIGNQIIWAQDQVAYLDFITSRGAVWLGLPRIT
jgi:hypothetical protein